MKDLILMFLMLFTSLVVFAQPKTQPKYFGQGISTMELRSERLDLVACRFKGYISKKADLAIRS